MNAPSPAPLAVRCADVAAAGASFRVIISGGNVELKGMAQLLR